MKFHVAGVVGNLTSLVSLDLSHNKIHDLVGDSDIFRIPPTLTELYLTNNELHDLPWKHLLNVTHLAILNVQNNSFATFGPELMKILSKGTDVYFEGKHTTYR